MCAFFYVLLPRQFLPHFTDIYTGLYFKY